MTLNHVIPDALPAAERLAYRLNVYDAFTIALINLRGERQSIRNINKRFGVTLKSSWAERAVRAGGRVLSVDDVEHGIVRPQFKDPRVHMAFVCTAKGCPPLRSGAYVADQIDAQLDDQARRFLAQESRNFVNVHTAVVHGSPIFTWYKADFGSDYAAVGAFWARYVPDKRASSGQYAIRRLTDEKS